MLDSPDTPGNQPGAGLQQVPEDAGKLILPPPIQEYSPVTDQSETIARALPRFPHALPVKREVAPPQPLAKVIYYWRKDPAYKVFIIATCMVLIAGIIFVSLAAAAVIHHPNLLNTGTGGGVVQSGPGSAGTINFHPIFPTPGGGSGSNQSSQPPVTSTPALPSMPGTTPTSAPQPTPTQPQPGGTLTVQITGIPSRVFNGQRVQVFVNTSIPGASVHLAISYNAPPYYYVSATQQADGGGNAVLFWRVGVGGFARGQITARVIAVADANGQQTSSQVITVQVGTFGTG